MESASIKPVAPHTDASTGAPAPSKIARLMNRLLDASGRGLALFFGVFSLANSVAWLLDGMGHEDIWWIDLSFLPPWLACGFGVTVAVLLLTYGVAPPASRVRRVGTAFACVLLGIVAIANGVAFYQVWRAGRIVPGLPVPLSFLFAIGFAWLAHRALADVPPRRRGALGVAVVLVSLVIAFPVAQMYFFGTTDYRRPADAAVVFGARVLADGTLSTAAEDRVRTGVDLYHAGLVRCLVMSGGVGESGADEAVAMRSRAMQLGVPANAIILDSDGVNTDATVANTTGLFRAQGIRRVLAVSQSWHLPRVKLAYLAAGWDVCTVPATTSQPIVQTPYLMLREIPAFWKYWARSI